MHHSNNTLSKSAQTIQDVLLQKGLKLTVVELSESARTAVDAAQAIGCEVAQIVKSLVFKCQESHKPILVLASGINRVNEKGIAVEVGEKIVKADAAFTREVTGFAIGGIPPIGHTQVLETYIDEDLLQYTEIWAAAGTPHAVFCLKASDLVGLTHAKVISIK